MSASGPGLEDKVTIITGGGRGIGRTLALGFAGAGASVALVARTTSELEAVAEEIRGQGGDAFPSPTDVTKGAQVSEMVQKVVDRFGRIDVLVNCAGGGGFQPLLEMEEDAWDRMIDHNLKSVYLCCRAVGRVMVGQRGGSIINFSSGGGVVAVPQMTHYCASKAGVNQFTRALAAEWGPFNIRVNAISPGLTDTSLCRNTMTTELIEQHCKTVPLGARLAQPEDMLGIAMVLAGDTSSFITGAIIPVAGGPQ